MKTSLGDNTLKVKLLLEEEQVQRMLLEHLTGIIINVIRNRPMGEDAEYAK
tara:strand:- start:21068 stop:21220 length:153 start_codon:yes stop_codon:yes gene_type:complete